RMSGSGLASSATSTGTCSGVQASTLLRHSRKRSRAPWTGMATTMSPRSVPRLSPGVIVSRVTQPPTFLGGGTLAIERRPGGSGGRARCRYRHIALQVCTLITKDHLAYARVLARSVTDHEPGATFTVLCVDDVEGRFDP